MSRSDRHRWISRRALRELQHQVWGEHTSSRDVPPRVAELAERRSPARDLRGWMTRDARRSSPSAPLRLLVVSLSLVFLLSPPIAANTVASARPLVASGAHVARGGISNLRVPGRPPSSAKRERHGVRRSRTRRRVNPTTSTTTTTTTIAPAPPAPAPTTPPTTVAPAPTIAPPSGGGSLVFDDEFNGGSLDLSKWQPNWFGATSNSVTQPVSGEATGCYDPAQVSVPGDGNLHLDVVQRRCTAANGVTYNYATGIVTTMNSFSFTTGTLEARVFLPGTSSITDWPSVWTDGRSWPADGESDIVEGLSGHACYHYHSPAGGPGGCAAGVGPGWHTFKEVVVPGTTTYYYDGVRVGSISDPTIGMHPHYIILLLEMGKWGGAVQAPASMMVDYVRVWH